MQLIALLAVILGVASATQALAVGSIASVEGTAEIQQNGTWQPATIGAAVSPADVLRTGADGRVRIVFEAHSVLLIANETEVTVAEATVDPLVTLLHLTRGRLRALVEDAFDTPDAEYVIETDIALATVRGTDFIIVFDPVAEAPMPSGAGRVDVVGIDGRVEVHSTLDRLENAVFVTAQERVIVERGKLPGPPRRLEDALFKQYIEGLDFIGNGASESISLRHALVTGDRVQGTEQAAGVRLAPSVNLSHPAAPGEGNEATSSSADERPPVIKQPPRASVLTGGDLNVDF